jgi:hypothetical protein
MAGRVVVSTLNNDTGVLATQNGMTGIAKAWVNFNGTGTVAIRDSFNVSSITDNGTGDYTINFTTAMSNANYSFNLNATRSTLAAGNDAISFLGATPTTSALRISTTTGSGVLTDALYATVAIQSS